MARKRLFWQLYPSYLLLTVAALIIVIGYGRQTYRDFYQNQVAEELGRRCRLVGYQVSEPLQQSDWVRLDSQCKTLGETSNTRLTIILPSGMVVGDSDADPAELVNHADRPEIIAAMTAGVGRAMRFSDSFKRNMMYVAVALGEEGEIIAVIRAALPLTKMEHALGGVYLQITLAAVVIALMAGGIGWYITRRLSRPLEQMTLGARRFARGEFSQRISVPQTAELATLAVSLNKMARQLNDRIKAVAAQKSELEAILSSMLEGVIAVDQSGRIMRLNNAAAELLDIDMDQAFGRDLHVIVRNADFLEFFAKTLESDETVEARVNFSRGEERYFQFHGTGLYDGDKRRYGAVIVLNDMTQLQRLENIRRDFVANVSHELRTPITSIKGFIETLRDGGVDEPEQARRFLEIIAKQTDRLHAILEDLLILSRLEQGGAKSKLGFEKTDIHTVLEAAVELAQVKAEQNQISIELTGETHINLNINAALLEQALVNLIDNAIKYSRADDKVTVSAVSKPDAVAIAIEDAGLGIPVRYQDRIFERFYVVDKARSRKLGGTGLGLAIVKHIAEVHGGKVTVESTPGAGSIFTIHLPKN